MKNIIPIAIFASVLTACSAPQMSRSNPESIASIKHKSFDPSKLMELTSCITKGFKSIPQSMMHNHLTTQSISTEGYEVDLLGSLGGILMVGVDLNKNGTSIIYKSKYGESTFINAIQEQKESAVNKYEECFKK